MFFDELDIDIVICDDLTFNIDKDDKFIEYFWI